MNKCLYCRAMTNRPKFCSWYCEQEYKNLIIIRRK